MEGGNKNVSPFSGKKMQIVWGLCIKPEFIYARRYFCFQYVDIV